MPTCARHFLQTSKNMQRASSKRGAAGACLALAAFLAASFVPSCAAWAQTSDYVAPEAREVEPQRPVAAIVPQERIATSIDLGRIMLPGGSGGIIGALITSGTDRTPEALAQNAAAKANAFAAPLAQVLSDFDASILAQEATASALAGTPWFGSGEPVLLTGTTIGDTVVEGNDERGDSTVSMTFATGFIGSEANDTQGALNFRRTVRELRDEFAASNPDARELASVLWRYETSPDFTHVRVIADVELRRSGASTPHYAQQLISIVKLRRPTFVEEDNVAIWAKDEGALAREALTLAFVRAGEVLPAILALDKAGWDQATDRSRESATAAGYHGPVLLRDEKGPVFFAKDGDQRLAAFVTVQTIRN